MNLNFKEIQSSLLAQAELISEAGALVQIRSQQSAPWTINLGSFSNCDERLFDSQFPIYSIAKTLLAIFSLQLAEERLINLDAPISNYRVREIPEWLKVSSIRNLLSHRSGLSDYGSLVEYHSAVRLYPGEVKDKDNFVEMVFDKGPQFEKGSSFLYSNIGYLLVREILESVSGMGLQKLFDHYIGSKIGIEMKFLGSTSENIMHGHSPYLSTNAPDVQSLYNFSWVFHGTFSSNLSSLTSLFANLSQILKQDRLNEMTSLHRLKLSHPYLHPSYGLGLMGDVNSQFGPIFGHNGGGPGFSVAAYWIPTKNLSVAAVINRDSTQREAAEFVFESLKRICARSP